MVFFFLLIFLSAGFANVWLSQQCRNLTYSISVLENQIRREQEAGRRMEIEVARLRSPKRIERIAVGKLGLKTPNPEQIVMLP